MPPKMPKMNMSSATNEMLHTDITIMTQRTKVNNTPPREATNCHQNCQAINQLSYHMRQPAPIL
jgi:hypothetical protein